MRAPAVQDAGLWVCGDCTFENPAASAACDVCGRGRPASVHVPVAPAKPPPTLPARTFVDDLTALAGGGKRMRTDRRMLPESGCTKLRKMARCFVGIAKGGWA